MEPTPAPGFQLLVYSHVVAFRFLVVASSWCLSVLLPAYVLGAKYYECGRGLSRTTMSYLTDNVYSRFIATPAICVFILMAFEFLLLLPRGSTREYEEWKAARRDGQTCLSRSLNVVCWVALTVCLCIPSVFYIALPNLPVKPSWALRQLQHACPLAIVLINNLVLPRLARNFAALTGFSSAKLLMFSRLMTSSLLASITVVVLHANCMGGWALFWDQCSAELRILPETEGLHDISNLEDDTRLYPCSFSGHILSPWVRPGRCSRAVIESMTPLLLNKLVIMTSLQPAVKLARWSLSVQDAKGRCGCLMSKLLRVDGQFAQLTTLCELGIFWGPFIPLVLPLLALAVFTNLLVMLIGVKHFNLTVIEDNSRVSRPYISCAIAALVLHFMFFEHCNGIGASWLFYLGLTVASVVRHLLYPCFCLQARTPRSRQTSLESAMEGVELQNMRTFQSDSSDAAIAEAS